jgi:kinesin family protein 1/kinesin family protein 3/17
MGIYVESLAELVVSDSQGVQRLLDQGNSVRRVAATNMNERSSRSHSCFCIKVQQKKVEINEADGTRKETALNAKINLVSIFS